MCVMNGDNQMDRRNGRARHAGGTGEVDYTKANRLFTGEAWNLIPHYRYLGNALLSLLTKMASGYWHVADSQAGTPRSIAASSSSVDLDNIYPRYGYPNDMLVHLNVWRRGSATFRHARSTGSANSPGSDSLGGSRISWLLVKGFFWRMGHRYVIRDFHPLVFFYMAGFFSGLIGLALGSYAVASTTQGSAEPGPAIIVALMMTFSVLFTLFAMWFDMETNKDLR